MSCVVEWYAAIHGETLLILSLVRAGQKDDVMGEGLADRDRGRRKEVYTWKTGITLTNRSLRGGKCVGGESLPLRPSFDQQRETRAAAAT